MTGALGNEIFLGVVALMEEDPYILNGFLGDSGAFLIAFIASLEEPLVILNPILLHDSGNILMVKGRVDMKEQINYFIVDQ
jgi:hypothetical protein